MIYCVDDKYLKEFEFLASICPNGQINVEVAVLSLSFPDHLAYHLV